MPLDTHAGSAEGKVVRLERRGGRAADFSFLITPHRSLSDHAFNALIIGMLASAVAAQLFFLAIGVWIAGVVAAADGLFLAIAFVACRHDRDRVEVVSLRDGCIAVELGHRSGRLEFCETMPASGMTIHSTIDARLGCIRIQLHRGCKRIEIAGNLSPGERTSFLEAFTRSLRERGLHVREYVKQVSLV